MANKIKWCAIQPLTGGMYLGTEKATGCTAEFILSYPGFSDPIVEKKTGEIKPYDTVSSQIRRDIAGEKQIEVFKGEIERLHGRVEFFLSQYVSYFLPHLFYEPFFYAVRHPVLPIRQESSPWIASRNRGKAAGPRK